MQTLATTTEPVPEGLLLAQPVLDGHAQLLLPAGTPITRGILNSLQHRGIDTIFVNLPEVVAHQGEKLDPAAQKEQSERRVLHLFRPAMQAGQLNPLLHLILRYRSMERP